ncbi:MAG TPA: acyl-CoA dehydrogenase family protein [Gaiellaceae bacterium]|nr:acyl-CoA dehydrogenase family protein [Gaiellaceae bacterium]
MTPTVPELPADVRELKERVAAFLEREVYPLEQRVAEAGRIEEAWVDELRGKARAEGFSMRNMPAEAGGGALPMLGQVALEEESGKATNGLGFAVVDRGPAELWDIATPEQRERFVAPILRGEYREAWAVTEPGAGSDVSGIATTAERDGDDWRLNGEKWFVTSEGEPGFYLVLAIDSARGEGGGGEQMLFVVPRGTPGLELRRTPSFLHDPYLDHHPELVLRDCRVPDANRIPEGGGEGAREWFLVERLFIAARCCGAAARSLELARGYALERETFGVKIAEHQGVSFQLADSLTELLAARLLTYHAAAAFDTEPDRKVVHGKVAMAKLYASEAAGRIVDRALQVLGGRGYMTESPVARFYREVRVDRIWEGTSEIQRLIVSRGLLKRGTAPYLR